MLNEAVFRSPKWLRNYLDFEVNTGDDIKGEPSKRKVLKEWDKRWRECNQNEFKEFYSLVIKGERWSRYISSDELEKIRKELRGDMSIWEKFDKWLPGHKKQKAEEKERYERRKREQREREQKTQREKERKQERIKKELDDLFNALVKDFSNNPYNDKYSTPLKGGRICFHYRFENGDIFEMDGSDIKYKNHIYTVGLFYKNKFISLCNEISSKGRMRPGGYKQGSSSSSSSSQSKGRGTDPNRDRFNKMKDNIKLREDQLKSMSKTDPERVALENELDNLKRALQRMKDRFKFENVKTFWGWVKY